MSTDVDNCSLRPCGICITKRSLLLTLLSSCLLLLEVFRTLLAYLFQVHSVGRQQNYRPTQKTPTISAHVYEFRRQIFTQIVVQ